MLGLVAERDSSLKSPTQRDLEATPIPKELNRYVTEMATKYYDIGLELEIPDSQLRIIKNDNNFHNDQEKCREMLTMWLANDKSATWKKLCDTLQKEHIGLKVHAEKIATGSYS